MAKENPTWGYTGIQGARANLGHENGAGPVLCRERLGGMPKFYYRDAA